MHTGDLMRHWGVQSMGLQKNDLDVLFGIITACLLKPWKKLNSRYLVAKKPKMRQALLARRRFWKHRRLLGLKCFLDVEPNVPPGPLSFASR